MATTSLGRLTLDLAVKLSEFTDGMSKAERETKQKTDNMRKSVRTFKDQVMSDLGGTEIGGAIGSLSDRLSVLRGNTMVAGAALGGMAVGGAVAATGAIVNLAVETARADASMAKLAQTAGTGVVNFQILTHASKQYGISQEQLSSILADVQEKLGEFTSTGGGGAADFFDQLKARTGQTDDAMQAFAQTLQGKDGIEAIRMIKEKMDEWGITTQEQRFILESLGSDLGNLQPVLSMTAAEWDNYGNSLEEAGIVKSQEAIEKSIELEQQTRALTDTYDGIKNKLATAVIPVLADLVTEFNNATVEGDNLDKSLSTVDTTVDALQKTLYGATTELKLWIHDIKTWAYQIELTKNSLVNAFKSGSLVEGLEIMQEADALSRKTYEEAVARRKLIVARGNVLQAGYDPDKLMANSSLVMTPNKLFGRTSGFGSSSTGHVGPYKPDYSTTNQGAIQAVKTGKQLTDQAKEEAKAREKSAKAAKQTAVSVREAVLGGKKFGVSPGGKFGGARSHNGLDLLTPSGTQVYAPESGVIKAYGSNASRGGKQMILIADSGKKYGFAHLSSFDVSDGTRVPAGMGIAKTGATGTRPNGKGYGAHLHLTVTDTNGKKINPEIAKIITNQGLKYDDTVARANEKAFQEQQRAAEKARREEEQRQRKQLQIAYDYADERTKLELDLQQEIEGINEAFGKGSIEAKKYIAEAKQEFDKKIADRAISIMKDYWSEEKTLQYQHEQRIEDIKKTFVENDPTRQLALDLEEAQYQESLKKLEWSNGAKLREQEKYMQSLRESMQSNMITSMQSSIDRTMKSTLRPDEYEQWRLGADEAQAYNSVGSQYSDRKSEINKTGELGEYVLPEEERFKLLEEAKLEHEQKLYAIEAEFGAKRLELDKQQAAMRTQIQSSAFSDMTSLASTFFGENSRMHRAAFALERAFAVQKAVMNIQETYSNTFNAISAIPIVGPYIAAPMAAAASAMQVARAANLKGMSAPSVAGIAHGGLDYVPETATYLLKEGEGVIQPKQNKALTNFLSKQDKNSGSNITIIESPQSRAEVSQDNGQVTIKMVDKMIKNSFKNLRNHNSFESKQVQRNTTARPRR